jgi:hypothetical protein
LTTISLIARGSICILRSEKKCTSLQGSRRPVATQRSRTLGVAFACGLFLSHGTALSQPKPQVRDSSGVRIVEYVRYSSDLPDFLRVAPAPSLTIGTAAGEAHTLLTRVTSGVILRSGTIALANTGSQTVLFFDAQGRFIGNVGRSGQGPGEFSSLSWIKSFGPDGVIAYDRARRVTVIRDSAQLVRTTSLNGVPVGIFHDGTLLFSQRMSRALEIDGEVTRDSSIYMTVRDFASADAAVTDTVGKFPNSDLPVTTSASSGAVAAVISRPMPFARTASAAVVRDGFIFGDGSRYEIRFFTGNGVLRQVLRVDTPVHALTAGDVSNYLAVALARTAPETRAAQERTLRSLPKPRSVPAYGTIMVDDRERIWVQAFTVDQSSAHLWTVFDSTGSLLGRVETPANFRVLHFRSDRVLGVRTDADGVERVLVFSLHEQR